MKRVLTYGTFDLLHRGHINLLKRARALGDHLTVAVSTDEFDALKNKSSFHSFEDRVFILQAVRYVDEVIPESSWDQKVDDVRRLAIDVFVMGDDWAGKFDFLEPYCKVVYLPRTPGMSTSHIKSSLKGESAGPR